MWFFYVPLKILLQISNDEDEGKKRKRANPSLWVRYRRKRANPSLWVRNRRKGANPSLWVRNRRKKAKISGEPFLNGRGKYIPGKCTKPSCK